MKLTAAIAAVAILVTASAGPEKWVYNDHRRPIVQRTVPKPANDHSALCARWDGPRCLDDEEKPWPFAEEFRPRPSPEAEKAEALRIIADTNRSWKAYLAEVEKMRKGKKIFTTLQEVSDVADIDAGTDADA